MYILFEAWLIRLFSSLKCRYWWNLIGYFWSKSMKRTVWLSPVQIVNMLFNQISIFIFSNSFDCDHVLQRILFVVQIQRKGNYLFDFRREQGFRILGFVDFHFAVVVVDVVVDVSLVALVPVDVLHSKKWLNLRIITCCNVVCHI